MHSGTAAAKEAANVIDLESDPTKLIDLVGIGKQMLITRGALTTFSIANDVAKYFAILPALFIFALPGLSALDVMHLATPRSAILSALIFNALIIPVLIPLALKGVRFRPGNAGEMLHRNLIIYGLRWPRRAVYRHQADRFDDRAPAAIREHDVKNLFLAALRISLVTWVLCGVFYPLAVTGLGQLFFPYQANGSLKIAPDGAVIGSTLIGQYWTGPAWFHGRLSATTAPATDDPAKTIPAPYNAANSGGSNLGPTNKLLKERLMKDRNALEAEQPELAGQAGFRPICSRLQRPV